MSGSYLLENGTDRYLLEDGSGVYLLEGAGVDVTVTLTGNTATLTPGTLSPTGGAVVSISGNAGTLSVGTVTATGGASISVVGSAITGLVGTATISGDANVSLSGNQIVLTAGDVTVVIGGLDVVVSVSGVQIAAFAGVLDISGSATVYTTGNSLAASAGSVTIIVIGLVPPADVVAALTPIIDKFPDTMVADQVFNDIFPDAWRVAAAVILQRRLLLPPTVGWKNWFIGRTYVTPAPLEALIALKTDESFVFHQYMLRALDYL